MEMNMPGVVRNVEKYRIWIRWVHIIIYLGPSNIGSSTNLTYMLSLNMWRYTIYVCIDDKDWNFISNNEYNPIITEIFNYLFRDASNVCWVFFWKYHISEMLKLKKQSEWTTLSYKYLNGNMILSHQVKYEPDNF